MFSVSAIVSRINGKGEQVFQNDPKDSTRCLRIKVEVAAQDVPHIFTLVEAICQTFRYPLYEKEYYRLVQLVSRSRQVLPRAGSKDLLYVIEDTQEPLENFSVLREADVELIAWLTDAPKRIDGETTSRAQGVYALFVNQTEENFDYMTEGLYMSYLHKAAPLSMWHCFYTPKCEFPSAELLKQLDGIVLTGSKANCDEFDLYGTWVTPLMKVLEQAASNPRTKIMGTCFGHQIMAQALGGAVTQRDGGLWRGVETVELTPEMRNLSCFQKYMTTTGKTSFQLSLTHGREVSKLPPKATLGGFSKTCGVEIFTIGDQVLCLQGHPEYSVEYLTLRGMILLNVSKEEAEKQYSSVYIGNESNTVLEICTDFLFAGQ